jgi:hypothetical protein
VNAYLRKHEALSSSPDTAKQRKHLQALPNVLQEAKLSLTKNLINDQCHLFGLLFHFFWGGRGCRAALGFKVRALCLLGMCSTICALSAFLVFQIGSPFMPRLAWTAILLFLFPT